MWNFASNCVGSGIRSGVWNKKMNQFVKVNEMAAESDDEISSHSSSCGEDEGLECPICWEYFNIVENVPYVLWCGHSVCKNCILGLQWGSIIKFPSLLPLQLPLFISCPWCNFLSPRLIYKGKLKFPSKNYFLLSMVEGRSGESVMKSHSSFFCGENYCPPPSNRSTNSTTATTKMTTMAREIDYSEAMMDDEHMSVYNLERLLQYYVGKCVELMTKFPLVVIFMVIVLYAVPASATILALYAVITVLFAVPSFLILYFAYPSLDWLVREIIT